MFLLGHDPSVAAKTEKVLYILKILNGINKNYISINTQPEAVIQSFSNICDQTYLLLLTIYGDCRQ